ncbi:MgtC/SapB family protein [Mesobacillus harenae]|uniref:MgtC/SapB family protein n=1 Tax=Mesobacillus harenae TaxID=2213203 RepID=UPI0015810E8C|nr:MgtC/SapB family protein [Mesobacillus harenae]
MKEIIFAYVDFDVLIKLSFAALAGIIIGLERELKGKPFGLKTCLIVSVTACLLTVVSYESSFLYSKAYSRPMDPGRIPSYILSGIGFLGAGVILRRSNEAISGLTTAALVFSSAAIGITIGAGFYFEALTGVIFIFTGVRIIPYFFEKLGPKRLKLIEFKVRICAENNTDLTRLLKEMRGKQLEIRRVKVKEERDDIVISCIVQTDKNTYATEVFYLIKKFSGVVRVEVENME